MTNPRKLNPFQKLSTSHDLIYNHLATFDSKKELGALASTSKHNFNNVHRTKSVESHLHIFSEAMRAFALDKNFAGNPSTRMRQKEKSDEKLVLPDSKTIKTILDNKEDLLITRLHKLYNHLREPINIYVRNTKLVIESLNPLTNLPKPLMQLLRLEPFIRGVDEKCSETLRDINQALHESFVDDCFDDDDATLQLEEEKILPVLSNLGGIDATDRFGTTFLINCCREELQPDEQEQNIPMIRALLKNGANVNAQNSRGETPLICAINEKSVGKTWLLLTHGAKLDSLHINSKPLLIRLATQGDYHTFLRTILPYLKYYQANINIQDKQGQTALMHAVANNFEKIAEALVEQEANINVTDNNGETALMKAIMRAALFNHGEVTPMIQFLLAKGADVLIKNTKGKTALDYAELYPELNSYLNNYLAVVPYEPPQINRLGRSSLYGTKKRI